MIKMIALRDFPYGGKRLKRGDAFEVRDKTHARQLREIGFAQDAVKRGRPPKAVEVEQVAQAQPEVTQEPDKPRKSKRYETRDLIAD